MYFFAAKGRRTAFMLCDMTDSSQIPPIVEPLLQGLDAAAVQPVTNRGDLQKGLTALRWMPAFRREARGPTAAATASYPQFVSALPVQLRPREVER